MDGRKTHWALNDTKIGRIRYDLRMIEERFKCAWSHSYGWARFKNTSLSRLKKSIAWAIKDLEEVFGDRGGIEQHDERETYNNKGP